VCVRHWQKRVELDSSFVPQVATDWMGQQVLGSYRRAVRVKEETVGGGGVRARETSRLCVRAGKRRRSSGCSPSLLSSAFHRTGAEEKAARDGVSGTGSGEKLTGSVHLP
jgi:hypothetical protein